MGHVKAESLPAAVLVSVNPGEAPWGGKTHSTGFWVKICQSKEILLPLLHLSRMNS